MRPLFIFISTLFSCLLGAQAQHYIPSNAPSETSTPCFRNHTLKKHIVQLISNPLLQEPERSSLKTLIKMASPNLSPKALSSHFLFLQPKAFKDKPFLTGYYTPTIEVSSIKDELYRFPLYTTPAEKKLRQAPRFNIDELNILANKQLELAYAKSLLEVFFIHVQGSGYLKFKDSTLQGLAYDSNNSMPYTSIGKLLIKDNQIKHADISMQSIKDYFSLNPSKLKHYLYQNKRYIFFKKSNTPPTGSLGSPVTAYHSIATEHIKKKTPSLPPFIPILIHLDLPHYGKQWLIVFNEDTGSAIKGTHRFDLYTGHEQHSAKVAGDLKTNVDIYILWPKGISFPKTIRNPSLN